MTRQLIVGMPESGKSTFIGALRHILVAKEVETELELTILAGDEIHLNRLEDKWLSCEAIGRTQTSSESWVEFNVRDRSSGKEGTMIIPDLRGEHFERPAVAGQCPKDLYEALAASGGILLFTNVNREDDMLLIDDFGDLSEGDDGDVVVDARLGNDAVAGAGPTTPNDKLHASGTAEAEGHGQTKFRPEDMAEEVKIVEFLQMANRRPLSPKSRKLALIASAWDLLEAEEGITPESWLDLKRPMLAQFLANNADLWELRVYGVSAQGGRLPERKTEFEGMLNQSERVRIVGHGAVSHDLSAPLRWLMTDG